MLASKEDALRAIELVDASPLFLGKDFTIEFLKKASQILPTRAAYAKKQRRTHILKRRSGGR